MDHAFPAFAHVVHQAVEARPQPAQRTEVAGVLIGRKLIEGIGVIAGIADREQVRQHVGIAGVGRVEIGGIRAFDRVTHRSLVDVQAGHRTEGDTIDVEIDRPVVVAVVGRALQQHRLRCHLGELPGQAGCARSRHHHVFVVIAVLIEAVGRSLAHFENRFVTVAFRIQVDGVRDHLRIVASHDRGGIGSQELQGQGPGAFDGEAVGIDLGRARVVGRRNQRVTVVEQVKQPAFLDRHRPVAHAVGIDRAVQPSLTAGDVDGIARLDLDIAVDIAVLRVGERGPV